MTTKTPEYPTYPSSRKLGKQWLKNTSILIEFESLTENIGMVVTINTEVNGTTRPMITGFITSNYELIDMIDKATTEIRELFTAAQKKAEENHELALIQYNKDVETYNQYKADAEADQATAALDEPADLDEQANADLG